MWCKILLFHHPTVPVDPPEGTSMTGTPSPALQGNAVTFTCKVTGEFPPVDKYEFNFNSSSGWVLKHETNDGRYTINNVQESDQGTYQCVPSNAAGPGTKAIFRLAVNGTFVFVASILLCFQFWYSLFWESVLLHASGLQNMPNPLKVYHNPQNLYGCLANLQYRQWSPSPLRPQPSGRTRLCCWRARRPASHAPPSRGPKMAYSKVRPGIVLRYRASRGARREPTRAQLTTKWKAPRQRARWSRWSVSPHVKCSSDILLQADFFWCGLLRFPSRLNLLSLIWRDAYRKSSITPPPFFLFQPYAKYSTVSEFFACRWS